MNRRSFSALSWLVAGPKYRIPSGLAAFFKDEEDLIFGDLPAVASRCADRQFPDRRQRAWRAGSVLGEANPF